MKEFNELFKKATIVADHRRKVFNELIEKTKTEILPRYCESMKKLGYSKFYIDMKVPVFSDMEEKESPDMDSGYPISINSDQSISICDYEFDGREGIVFTELEKVEDLKFTKTGIVQLINEMNCRLEKIIEKCEQENEEAESLLK